MSKKRFSLNPLFLSIIGNFRVRDEHGHLSIFRFRETPWGTRSFSIGPNAKRNLSTHPFSPAEIAQHEAFTRASSLRVLIFSTPSLLSLWQSRFQSALDAGTTSCHTLNGFLIQQAIRGHISSTGLPL